LTLVRELAGTVQLVGVPHYDVLGISFPPAAAYQVIAMQEHRATELGYPDLR
jgi:hypothetical protein